MNKAVLTACICCFIIIQAGAQVFSNYLKVNITQFPAGKKDGLFLLRFYGEDFTPVDSVLVSRDTAITFGIKNLQDGLYALKWISEKENQAEVLLTKPEKEIKVEATYVQLLNGELAISDSPENTAYFQLIELRKKHEPHIYDLTAQLNSVSVYLPDYKQQLKEAEDKVEKALLQLNEDLDKLSSATPGTFTAKVLIPLAQMPNRLQNPAWMQQFDGYRSLMHKHFFHYVDFNNPALLQHYSFIDKVHEYLSTYTEKNAEGSKAAIDVLMQSLKENEEVNSFVYNSLLRVFIKFKSEALVKHLTEKHSAGCSLNLSLEDLKKLTSIQSTTVGSKAPDVLLYDHNSKPQSLYEQCRKNKITILAFWVSWCTRCKKEMPELENLHNRYKKSGLGLFTVSVDEKKEDWLNALAENKLSGVNVSELVPVRQSKVLPLYSISTTPAIFILNKDGKILAKNMFGAQLEETIKTALK